MSIRRTILTNTAALYALQVANYVFPLLVMPYLLRAIGVRAFGEIAFAGAVTLAFVAVVEFSFNYTATARIAARADDVAYVSSIYSVVMATKFVLLLGATALLALLTATVPALRGAWLLVCVQWPMLLGEVLFPTWLFQGVQKFAFVTLFHVISRVTTLVLLLVFVHEPGDAALAAGIQASHYVVAGVVAQATARWMLGIRFHWPERQLCQELVRDSSRVFVGSLGVEVYVRAPMVLVGFLASPPQVGAFAVAQKITSLLTLLAVPATQSLYPHLCALAERHPERLAELRRKLVLAMALALSLAVVCLNLAAERVVALISGTVDRSVISMLLLFSPVVVVTATNMMLKQFVMALRRFDDLKRVSLVAAAILLVLVVPLTHWFDAHGMILATLVVEGMMFFKCLQIARSPYDTGAGVTPAMKAGDAAHPEDPVSARGV